MHQMELPKKMFTVKMISTHGKKRNPVKQAILMATKAVAGLRPISAYTSKLDRIAKTYASANDSQWIENICQRWVCPTEMLRREWFDETVELEFEGSFFPAPPHYDEVLTAWYGDYMQLPPEAERVTHHSYRAYQR